MEWKLPGGLRVFLRVRQIWQVGKKPRITRMNVDFFDLVSILQIHSSILAIRGFFRGDFERPTIADD